MEAEVYNYLKSELYNNAEGPLILHAGQTAQETAREFFEELKKAEPNAFIISVEDGPQYIGVTEAARRETAQLLEERAKDLQELAKTAANEEPRNPRTNGFLFLAESCRRMADEEDVTPEDREEYKARVRVYEILADFSKGDICRAFNSGAFNDILKGYITLMFEAWKKSENEETRNAAEILGKYARATADDTLDFYNAQIAQEAYNEASNA